MIRIRSPSASAALWMPRSDERQQARKVGAQPSVGFKDGTLFPGVGRGGSNNRPVADGILQGRERGRVSRRGWHVELEITGRENLRRPKLAEAHCVGGSAGEAKIEPLQKIGDGVRKALPAPERIFREPPVDQDQGHAAIRGFDDHVRPEVGFHEQCEVGSPMIEEAADEARNVDRDELMHDAAR